MSDAKFRIAHAPVDGSLQYVESGLPHL